MSDVTIRDLRNHGGDVVERVLQGETLIVTRAGVPVARLSPVPRKPLRASVLLSEWRRLPRVDPAAVRGDIDAVIDPSL